ALAGLLIELVDLLAMQQQLALAAGRVVRPRAVQIFRDVGSVEPRFTVLDEDVSVDQRGATHAQRLDLAAREHETRLVSVEDVVVVPRLLVRRDQFLTGLSRHAVQSSATAGRAAPHPEPEKPRTCTLSP